MKYCIKCGHVLPDFANFCPVCGAKQPLLTDEIEEEEVTLEQPIIKEEPVIEEPVKEEEPIVEPTPEPEPEPIKEEAPVVEEKPVPEVEEQSPVKEEPISTPSKEDEAPLVVKPAKSEEKEDAPKQAEPAKETGKKENKAKADFSKMLNFLLTKDIIKYSLIFLGGLFALSLLFWIINYYVQVFVFFKLILFLASGLMAARIGYLLFKEIKTNKASDLFNLMLKGTIAIVHAVLFVLNIIFLFS